jgi:hypothetical protein
MQSDINHLAAEIFKDGIEVLKDLLEEIKVKTKEMWAGIERNCNIR